MTSSDRWSAETAATYDADAADMFDDAVLGPTLDALERLADGGAALEFAVGTGRVAVPLVRRGVPVSGIELSEPMVERLREKASADELPVVVGDMASTIVAGSFSLVYLVFNTLGNLLTQEEQAACFANAARHLSPGGAFVIEIGIPPLRRFPPGAVAVPFDIGTGHVGFDTLDPVSQRGTSHHYTTGPDGAVRYGTSNFRWVWPAECDLMARLAGLELESRHADWPGTPFTADSTGHVSVWRKAR